MFLRAEHPGPVDLFDVHCAAPQEFPFLLQSVAGHRHSGRYDILFGHPRKTIIAASDGLFFDTLSAELQQTEPCMDEGLPFVGGWFFLLNYEAARHAEPALQLPPSPDPLPDAWAVRCTAALIYDHQTSTCHCVAEDGPEQLAALQSLLKNNFKYVFQNNDSKVIKSIKEASEPLFIDGVQRIHDYLAAGDIYQVNLSRRWDAELAPGVDYRQLYARLRRNNPAPFSGLARWQDHAILSSSPERLIRVEQGWAETRPIAGTRPRSADPDQDALLLNQLHRNLKERAEHVMLIDLERNDLGRVCEKGSIEVNELMTVETYAHVHHIVSNVRGRLRAEVDCAQALKAVFPGGTITGCPKIRAMQIIAELEREGRGPYTGSMGYISNGGRMDSNILIRSLVCDSTHVSFRTGAGIVADSDATAELAETRAKAKGLLLALGMNP